MKNKKYISALAETVPDWYRMLVLILMLICLPIPVNAHAPRENYVWVNVESDHIAGRFEIKTDDLKRKLGVDVIAKSGDALAGVRSTAPQVQQYLKEHFSLIDENSILELEFQEPTLFSENHKYAQYPFRTRIPQNDSLTVINSIFLTPDLPEYDKLHRSLLVVEYNKRANKEFGNENVALVFSPRKTHQKINLTSPESILQWQDFLWQGMLHIWAGFDHLIFVSLFLLTSVVRSERNSWTPVPTFTRAFWRVLKIVTIFTVAHTITLTLATLEIVNLNTALVEIVIAFSILAVAFFNVMPKYAVHGWVMIFIFGLFHGLGFASVLGELQFRNVLLERILIMFNVGVEVGQLAVVTIIFPILFLLRKSRHYTRLVINPLSGIAAVIAVIWILQRMGMAVQ